MTKEVRKNRTIYKSRNKKRKQSFNPKTAETDDGGATTSARKLKSQDEYHVPKTNTVDYRIINFVTVFSAIASLVKCAKCNSKISFGIVSERGLGFKISVVCDKCTPEYIPSCDFIKIMPKTLPASFTTVSIAANIATCTFIEGTRGLLAVFDAMGIKLGPHAHTFAKEEDSIRVEAANGRSLENTREGGSTTAKNHC